MMFQLENVPTRGKLDGEVRIKAENTTQYPTSTLGRVDGYKAVGMIVKLFYKPFIK